ncbi:MAG: aromatic aminobenezylarsenical efflux permease ArsG family transporter [Dehalococcoidia bacterium]
MDIGGFFTDSNIPVLSAFFLGLITAISPCPLATNIAAIAYITQRVSDRKYAVTTGALYTLGRVFSYSVLGILIIVAGMEIPGIARFLQDVGDRVLGPLLIIVGLLMLFIDKLSFGRGGGGLAALGGKVANWGMFGGFLLGVIFALAFCPYSAVLYFAVLIPLALKSSGGVALPAVYAIGTGLPVLIIGTLLSFGVAGISSWLNAISRAERVIRIVVAIIFIGIGIYYVIQWVQVSIN